MKRTRFIGLRNYDSFYDGGVESNYTSNSKLYFGISSNASNLRLVYRNAHHNYAASNSDLNLRVGVALFSSDGTPQGAGYQSLNSGNILPVPKTSIYTTGLLPMSSVAAGQYIFVSQYASGSAVIPATRKANPTLNEKVEFGANLTPILDGTVTTTPPTHPSDYHIFTPTLVGQTSSAALGAVGHSLVRGVGANYEYGFQHIAGEILSIPCITAGVGGATAGSIGTNMLDIAAFCTVVAYLHVINDINSAGGVGTSASGFITSMSSTVAYNIQHIKSYGCKVVICTEGVNETGGSYTQANVIRAAWNDFVRSYGTSVGAVAGGTGLGADGICDIASVLETSPGNNVPVPGVAGIHWGDSGHRLVGAKLAQVLSASGFTSAETSDYKELFYESFQGDITASGNISTSNLFGGTWRQFSYHGSISSPPYRTNYFFRNGFSGLSLAATSNNATMYYYHSDNLTTGSYKSIVTLAPFKTQVGTNTGGSITHGPGIGFAHGAFQNSLNKSGYYLYFRGNSVIQLFSVNSSLASTTLLSLNLTGNNIIATNDVLRVELDWTQNGVSTDISFLVYRGKTAIAGGSVTGSTTAGIQSGGNFTLAFMGDSNNVPVTGEYFKFAVVSKYNPITVDSVEPTTALLEIERGMTRVVKVKVLDDTGADAVGETVTAAYTGDSGVTVTASSTTDNQGYADIYIASLRSMVAGSTGSVLFTSNNITGTLDLTVVDEFTVVEGGSSNSSSGLWINGVFSNSNTLVIQ